MKIKVKIKKFHENATVPKYQTKGAVAFDICALNAEIICPGEQKMIHTGIAVEIPKGYEMTVRQRSGLSLKYPGYIVIGIGTVDQDYRGEIKVPILNITSKNWFINKGERIAQAVISPVVRAKFIEVDELSETKRGKGGFGHTG